MVRLLHVQLHEKAVLPPCIVLLFFSVSSSFLFFATVEYELKPYGIIAAVTVVFAERQPEFKIK